MNDVKPRAALARFSACVLAACSLAPICFAADSDIVGSVALLVDPAVSKQLNLSLTQREKFAALVNRRENEALELANLPPQEQAARLAEFRRRTEAEAIADLTEVQRTAFTKVRLGRTGVESFAEEQIASQLSLSDEQQKQISALLTERAGKLAIAAASERQTVRGQYDQQIAGILSPEQKTKWEQIAGVALPASTGNTASPPAAATTPTSPADAKPAVPADATKAPVELTEKKPKPPTNTAEVPVTKPGVEATQPETKASPKEGPSRSYGRRKFGEGKPSFAKPGDPKSPGGTKSEANARAKPTGIEPPLKSHDGLIQFSFRNQPWGEVLDWFAGQAGLSLYMVEPPTGVFNYSSPERYTPEKAIDLLNSALWMKGLVLIRNDRMLMLVKTDDIPPILVPVVSEDDLDKRGDYELVRVIFQLQNATPEEVQQEIRALVSKQGGSIEILSKARQIQVTETAGHLRAIRKVIDSIENPKQGQQIHTIELKHATADQILGPVRGMLGLPPDGFVATDGSLRIMVDPASGNLLVTGRTEKINQLREVVNKLDVPSRTTDTDGVIETPQLEVYAVSTADPVMVLAVLQTMMAGQPDIRLDKDAKTGSLVAWARPSQHRAIKAMIDQLQKDAKQVEVIRLKRVDPQLAVLAIQKLFGGADATGTQAPIVDAEPTSRQLMVRATSAQIDQIRSLLRKMGEQESTDEGLADKSKIRVLPLTGRQARMVLEQAEVLWPVQGSNKIRLVTPSSPTDSPSSSIPSRGATPDRASTSEPATESARFSPDYIEQLRSRLQGRSGETPARRADEVPSGNRETPAADTLDRRTQRENRGLIRLAAAPAESNLAQADAKEAPAKQLEQQPVAPSPPTEKSPDTVKLPAKKPADGKEPPPIIVTVTPGGIVISSEDTKALDEFEDLVNTLSSTASSGGREFTVFYLKHAKAENAAELLDEVFGGGSSGSSGGGSLLGDLAGAALGGSGGGLVSSLLGGSGGSGGFSTGLVDIVPDTRLNALIVQANPTDLDSVEQLLKVVDQPSSVVQVEVPAKPRFIQVYNNQAEDIATIVRQVYSEHITGAGAANANQMRQPSPEDFIRMLRGGGGGGGRGRGGRGGRNERQEAEKMTVSVDGNSNSLIVAAPENLFQQVKGLVDALDRMPSDSRQSTQVVTLRRASPLVVQQALTGLLGDKVKSNTLDANKTATSRTSSSSSTSSSGAPQTGQGTSPFGQQGGDAEERMRRFQDFREMMRQGGGPGGGRDGGGRDGGGEGRRGRDGGGDRGGRGGRGDRD